MEEFISESQRQEIIRKRQEMLKKIGVPNAGKMINESIVATNSANMGMAQKLAAIRSGAAKAELNKYITATGQNAPTGAGEFQEIPEPKMRKNPNQVKEEIKPEHKQQLQNFEAPRASSQELSAIDSLFGGDGPTRMPSSNGQMAQAPMNSELSLDNVLDTKMPTFNPHAIIQNKIRNNTQAAPNPYLKYASDTLPVGAEQFVDVSAPVQQPQVNVAQLQSMMETIAKGIAEKTIRSVLSEYSEQHKSKVYFEYYNKEKGIIKTPDGKYYRLQQVELKKKQS